MDIVFGRMINCLLQFSQYFHITSIDGGNRMRRICMKKPV
jgi:hypothetical protein